MFLLFALFYFSYAWKIFDTFEKFDTPSILQFIVITVFCWILLKLSFLKWRKQSRIFNILVQTVTHYLTNIQICNYGFYAVVVFKNTILKYFISLYSYKYLFMHECIHMFEFTYMHNAEKLFSTIVGLLFCNNLDFISLACKLQILFNTIVPKCDDP